MNNGRSYKDLQSWRTACGHLFGYASTCEGLFSFAPVSPICRVYKAFNVLCKVSAVTSRSFARQVLNSESDSVGNEEVVESYKVFIKDMKAILSRKGVENWAVPVGLVPAQTFSVHIMPFVGNMYKASALYEKYRYIPLSQCSEK